MTRAKQRNEEESGNFFLSSLSAVTEVKIGLSGGAIGVYVQETQFLIDFLSFLIRSLSLSSLYLYLLSEARTANAVHEARTYTAPKTLTFARKSLFQYKTKNQRNTSSQFDLSQHSDHYK